MSDVQPASPARVSSSDSDNDEAIPEEPKIDVVYHLRDIKKSLVDAWQTSFSEYKNVQISHGDIFRGAPAADAIVSPANSFGFMDGGIDMVYSMYFGWQMQERLQVVIRNEKDGEILVGDAVIIPAYREGTPESEQMQPACNEGKPIKYLVSAPTMRVPEVVATTSNAYLAFRAVILAVQKHNKQKDAEPIRSVLCPGLATSVGKMPSARCAGQMKLAYEMYDLGMHTELHQPEDLSIVWNQHQLMSGTSS